MGGFPLLAWTTDIPYLKKVRYSIPLHVFSGGFFTSGLDQALTKQLNPLVQGFFSLFFLGKKFLSLPSLLGKGS